MMLYLIDFPRLDYVCTPHLDLARFRFGLELVKQFPPAKFFGLNRWDVDSLFERFIAIYCREMHVALSQDDLWLIARARKAYIRRAQDLARKGRCGLQPKLERAYLQTFSQQWLDQGDVFSQVAENGPGGKSLKRRKWRFYSVFSSFVSFGSFSGPSGSSFFACFLAPLPIATRDALA